MDYKTIKDLSNGDFFSPLSNPKSFYQLKNKYAYTKPSKNPHLDYERYAIAVSKLFPSRPRSFAHSTQIIKREYE